MKQTRRITLHLLCLLLIFTFLAQGTQNLYQMGDTNALDSSLINEEVSTLRNNDDLLNKEDLSYNARGLKIVGTPPHVYAPGSDIHIRNRFNTSEDPAYAVVNQDIKIYLNPSSDPESTDSNYYTTATTNGTSPPVVPALTDNTAYGWLDTIITLPNMAWFTDHGIAAGEDVTIFQQYPSGNVSSLIQNIAPINVSDTFMLVGFATISEEDAGFVNINSSDASFRQGEGASVILKAQSEGTDIANVDVSCDLRYSSNDSVIPFGINGMEYYLEDKLTGSPSTTTDSSGEIRLRVSTSYPDTPEDDYYIKITGDFDGTGYYTENYVGTPSANYHSSTANFTINNELDVVSVQFITATGFTSSDPKGDNSSWPLNPPRENITLVKFRVQATTTYSGSSTYDLANIPVNATLDFGGDNPEGVFLSGAPGFGYNGSWAFTDASGYVQFNITAIYPILFRQKTPTIKAIANIKNGSTPIYPVTSPHRFLTQGNSTGSQVISIDPDYQVGWISYGWQNNDRNIRPGETATLNTHINLGSNYYGGGYNKYDDGAFVPVKVELVETIQGVSLVFNNTVNPLAGFSAGYRLTDAFGNIKVVVNSTFGVSPEYRPDIQIRITADFENDSNLRWIGIYHAGTNTIAEYNKTWNYNFASFSISSNYTVCRIELYRIRENGIYFYPYSTYFDEAKIIRPGDTLEIHFRVREDIGPLVPLINVPVNISLNVSIPGVSLTVIGGSVQTYWDGNYYNTTSGGRIDIQLTTNRILTPKDLKFKLSAVANFSRKISDFYMWHVGQKNTTKHIGNSSYSDVNLNLTLEPQYFTGHIYPTGGYPNPAKPRVNETVRVIYNLKLSNEEGEWFPSIHDVNISLQINGTSPESWNMVVSPDSSQNSSFSSATFDIMTNATGTGNTPEGIYIITARADFVADDGLIYTFSSPFPVTVPDGSLSGYWINGSDPSGYSFELQTFEVRDVSLVSIQVNNIFDPLHPDAGLNLATGYYDVYRGTTTITIGGSYKDINGQANPGEEIRISFNHTLGTDNLATVFTDGQGKFTVNVTIPNSISLQDIQIYGWDPDVPDPREARDPIDTVRLVSTLNLVGHALSGYSGSAVFVGESATISGSLRDDQNDVVNDTELNGALRVIGWNGTHEVVGSEIIGSTYSNGAYSLNYIIPLDYPNDSITIRFNITNTPQLLHYRPNFDDSLSVLVYRGFQIDSLRIYYPDNAAEEFVSNDSTIVVKGVENRTIYLRGTLLDSTGRPLNDKQVNESWNLVLSPSQNVDFQGNFSIPHDFPGWENITTLTWEIYHVLDNGTVLTKLYTIAFKWEVYDETAPMISITSPSAPNDVLAPTADTTIIASIVDPNGTTDTGYVSGGLDELSITIYIDDMSHAMSGTAPTFTYSWDPSPPTDVEYNITLTASDNAGNLATLETLFVIDIKDPTLTLILNQSNGYLRVFPSGDIVIRGSITDSSSSTGRNSGVDDSTVELIIQDDLGIPILTLDNTELAVDQGSFSYNWTIYDPSTLTKVSPFNESDQWTLALTFEDVAGNTNTVQENVQLDNTPPDISVSSQPLATVIDTVSVTITFTDDQTGMNSDSLVFDFVSTTTQDTLLSFDPSDSEVDISPGSTILSFNASGRTPGSYFIRASVYDNAANLAEVNSNDFTIQEPTSTPTTQTTGPPDPLGVLLTPVDILVFLIIDIIALGGGFGVAVIYERFRKARRI